jgi:sec-independent protein translocase protein TatA
MRLPGGWEWIIILVVVLLLFGPGRLSKIAGELGRGIREFRSGIKDLDDENESDEALESEKDSDQT